MQQQYKLTLACCTNPLRFGLQFMMPCELEILTQGQFKNSSWNLAKILELCNKTCTWTVQEHKLRTVQLLRNLWCTWIFHKLFLNILMTFLECCVDSGVLELFLNVFLIISETFLEYYVFLNCSYICSWLLHRLYLNIICSWTVLTFVLDHFKDFSWT